MTGAILFLLSLFLIFSILYHTNLAYADDLEGEGARAQQLNLITPLPPRTNQIRPLKNLSVGLLARF